MKKKIVVAFSSFFFFFFVDNLINIDGLAKRDN